MLIFVFTFHARYTYGEAVQGDIRLNLAVLDDAGKTERFSTSTHAVSRMKVLKNYLVSGYIFQYKAITYIIHDI